VWLKASSRALNPEFKPKLPPQKIGNFFLSIAIPLTQFILSLHYLKYYSPLSLHMVLTTLYSDLPALAVYRI
jgi:hypothetical protein